METNGWAGGPGAAGRGRGFAPGRGRGFAKWAPDPAGEERPVGASRQGEAGGGGTGDARLGYRPGPVNHTWGAPLGPPMEPLHPNRNRVVRSGCFRCGEEGHFSRECGARLSPGAGPLAEERFREDSFRGKNWGRDTQGEPQYIPDESLEENLYEHGVNSGINFDKYEDIPVKVNGNDVPDMIADFSDAGLNSLLMENISKSHYTRPTPVQKYAVPMVVAGRDVMGCAQTGSGKTAAFLIPIVNHLLAGVTASSSRSGPTAPQVVIMSPTRELAIQIKDEARKFCMGSKLRCVVAYGGTSVAHQGNLLNEGCNILVATPGRLKDFVERRTIDYSAVQYLVLDEADRMLDMGFKEDILGMVRHHTMPGRSNRRTLMFSATFPPEIQQMASEFMKPNYLFLAVGLVGGACSDVSQTFLQVPMYEKREKLLDLVKDSAESNRATGGSPYKTLVFVETKKTADFIASYLCQSSFAATSIHGDRLQREREQALNDFKKDRKPVLVATAVAARGLDIRGVQHVVNYDLPKSIDEYVHRIGRTGRLGNTGRATSFYDQQVDSGLAGDLLRTLADSQQRVPNWLEDEARRNPDHGGTVGSRFGARDIRTSLPHSTTSKPIEEDETWN